MNCSKQFSLAINRTGDPCDCLPGVATAVADMSWSYLPGVAYLGNGAFYVSSQTTGGTTVASIGYICQCSGVDKEIRGYMTNCVLWGKNHSSTIGMRIYDDANPGTWATLCFGSSSFGGVCASSARPDNGGVPFTIESCRLYRVEVFITTNSPDCNPSVANMVLVATFP